jgi:ferrous iron transport protein B
MTCHGTAQTKTEPTTSGTIVLVGAPNVGKSLLFHRLTGTYVTVSNYPGTTVEITRGQLRVSEPHPQPLSVNGEGCRRQGEVCELLDTPGIRSLLPLTEEEAITKDILLRDDVALIVHVADAKDVERSLALTLQLLELGPPVVLALNMIDEASAAWDRDRSSRSRREAQDSLSC